MKSRPSPTWAPTPRALVKIVSVSSSPASKAARKAITGDLMASALSARWSTGGLLVSKRLWGGKDNGQAREAQSTNAGIDRHGSNYLYLWFMIGLS